MDCHVGNHIYYNPERGLRIGLTCLVMVIFSVSVFIEPAKNEIYFGYDKGIKEKIQVSLSEQEGV